MTQRRYLSPKERALMLVAQKGKCACFCGCRKKITVKDSIGEHTHPVALGNAEKPDRLLCLSCADVKTNGTKATTKGSDKHSIARAKRLERKRLGTWPATRHPMKSRGFDKSLRKKMNGDVVRVDG